MPIKLVFLHGPSPVQVKASGGVPNLDMLLTIHQMGVTRSGV
jgi:hypothetical protein